MCLLWQTGCADGGTQPSLSWSAISAQGDFFFFSVQLRNQTCKLAEWMWRIWGTSGFNLRNPMNKLWRGNSGDYLNLLCPPQTHTHTLFLYVFHVWVSSIFIKCNLEVFSDDSWMSGYWRKKTKVCKSIFQKMPRNPEYIFMVNFKWHNITS